MSAQTVVSNKNPLFERLCNTPLFQNLFAVGLIGGGILTLLAGLVGLVTWVVALIARLTNSQIELGGYGWLFAATAFFLLAFNLAFAPMTFEGGSDGQTQRGMYWTLALSVICMLVTASGAYLVFSGSVHVMTTVLVVPIFNLVFFIFAIIAMIKA